MANPTQTDADADAIGDVCDLCTDTDGDLAGDPGFPANTCPLDNCPADANPGQSDADTDAIGDVCDLCTDTDGDLAGDPGFPANTCPLDNCPTTANPTQADTDADTLGDVCDNCPQIPNLTQENFDSDSQGDICDPDDDNDAVVDGEDSEPFNNLICRDVDADTCNDCSSGTDDVFNDGPDQDGEGICDATDNCPNYPNPGQESQLVFPESIIAISQNVFAWTTPADIVFVLGNIAGLPTYSTITMSFRSNKTLFTVNDPPVGQNRYYLVRIDCAVGTWVSGGPNECPSAPNCPNGGRDANLP